MHNSAAHHRRIKLANSTQSIEPADALMLLRRCGKGGDRACKPMRFIRGRSMTRPEHCYKLQAESIRGCSLDQIAAITMVAHARASGGGVPDASLLLPAGRVHHVCMA
jgi:hypothetical protein